MTQQSPSGSNTRGGSLARQDPATIETQIVASSPREDVLEEYVRQRAILQAAELGVQGRIRTADRLAVEAERRILKSRTLGGWAESGVQFVRDGSLLIVLVVGSFATLWGLCLLMQQQMRANNVSMPTAPTISITQ